MMGEWWVYEDFPVNRARVHRGECPFCKHGKGIHRNKEEGVNMKWHGAFLTRDEAWTFAQQRKESILVSVHFVVNNKLLAKVKVR